MRRTRSRRSINLHQVKMENTPSLFKTPKSECPDIWIHLPKNKNGLNHAWSSMGDLAVPLDRNLYGHPLVGLLWERQFEESSSRKRMGFSLIENVYSVTEKKDCCCLCTWTMSKLPGKKQNLDPMRKILMKDVDLGEPTSFRDHVYLGCTRRDCKTSKDLVDNYIDLFEYRMSAGGVENWFIQKILKQTFPLGPMIWKVMPTKAWRDVASLQTNRLNNYTKSQLHVLTTINSKKKREDLLENCENMLSNCPAMSVFGTHW